MSAEDQDLFGTMIKVENKDIFVDLKKNSNGVYLKLSERNGKSRNTVLIPSSGIGRLKSVLEEILAINTSSNKISPERRQRVAEDPEVVSRSVYVSGLAWATTSDALAAHFAQAGRVVKASVLNKTRNGKVISLGCGVVEFASSEEAALAVNILSNSELEGRAIKCREDRTVDHAGGESAAPEGGHGKSAAAVAQKKVKTEGSRVLDPKRVFVTSLPWETTSEHLMDIFGEVGRVVAAEVLSTKKGRSLGHAVVEFADPRAALAAVAELNGRDVDGRSMIVREYFLD
eukprot:gene28977-32724_t